MSRAVRDQLDGRFRRLGAPKDILSQAGRCPVSGKEREASAMKPAHVGADAIRETNAAYLFGSKPDEGYDVIWSERNGLVMHNVLGKLFDDGQMAIIPDPTDDKKFFGIMSHSYVFFLTAGPNVLSKPQVSIQYLPLPESRQKAFQDHKLLGGQTLRRLQKLRTLPSVIARLNERKDRQDEEARTGIHPQPQYTLVETFREFAPKDGLGRSVVNVGSDSKSSRGGSQVKKRAIDLTVPAINLSESSRTRKAVSVPQGFLDAGNQHFALHGKVSDVVSLAQHFRFFLKRTASLRLQGKESPLHFVSGSSERR